MAGVVERIPVTEGSVVARGAPIAYLRATSLRADREATTADAASADRLAALAASRGDASEERLHRIRAEALRREVALLDEQVELTHVARTGERDGAHAPRRASARARSLEEGDLLLTIGRTDSLELEFGVAQRDIARVRPGQEIRLRVDAMPQRTFVGRVRSVAPVPADSAAEVRYPVRAVVRQSRRCCSSRAWRRTSACSPIPPPPATRLLRAPVRWARLLWWRIWS